MKKIHLLILSLVFTAFAVAPIFAPATVSAANPATKACTGAASRSTFCHTTSSSSDNPLTGSNGVIVKATHIVAIAGGVAAVIIIIIAGISYTTSNGDAAQVAGAKRSIIYASVGLVVIALAQQIVTFIVSKI